MEHHNHTNVVNRLKSVSGHINGIITMLEEDRYCIDIIKQIQATQAALARVSEIILENHLDTCLTTAIRGDDPNERERVLAEVMEVFRTENRTK
ncbi:MAG: metal-sensitive transcriptional regulator [Anaerolineae bacterium]|nr:metal-sensitive transcriptional regulator [Anaerolineae bacterium]